MKPLANPADKKKAIGLGIACGLVLLFVIKNTMGAVAGSGQASTEPASVQISGSSSGAPAPTGPVVSIGGPAGSPEVKPADDLIDPPTYTLADTPNPFHKDTVGYSGPLDYKGPDLSIPPPIINPVPPSPRGRRGPRGGNDFNSGGTLPVIDGSKNPAMVIQHDPEPPQVMGVMTGDNPVAVIRVGGQQYVVTKGSKFGHNLRLKSVSATQVVIEDGGTLHILRVGVRPPSPPPSDQIGKVLGS